MTLLTLLGLLGLLSIVALIIIYIIRPNYQQKFVSSTFVWKLALKRKRKRIPTSKLRNILLIICQILILLSLTGILTTPAQELEVKVDAVEVVAIVDASASMRTKDADNVSRFERAIVKVQELADEAFSNDGYVSLMIAGNTNKFLFEKLTKEDRAVLKDIIDDIDDDQCTYGSSDLDQAVLSCQEIIEANPSTQLYIYSDIEYGYVPKDQIKYERIVDQAEGNLAILNAHAETNNSFYQFNIDVASYGKDAEISLDFFVNGANVSTENEGKNILLEDIKVRCTDSQVTSVVLCSEHAWSEEDAAIALEKGITYLNIKDCYGKSGADITDIYSFKSISVQINDTPNQVDSYSYDNTFNIYGGQKELITVQYASTKLNPFMLASLDRTAGEFSEYWDIRVDEKPVSMGDKDGSTYQTEGYDVYFFEHKMPQVLPTDGVVVLIDPEQGQQPYNSGFTVISTKVGPKGNPLPELKLQVEGYHDIMANVQVSEITTTKYTHIMFDSEYNYKILASVDGNPMFAVRDDVEGSPVVVMGLDVHHSNFPVMPDFMIYMLNLFKRFVPPTVTSHAYEVYENVEVKARSQELQIKDASTGGDNFLRKINSFPTVLSFDMPGTYELKQKTFANKEVSEMIYVRCPMAESNIFEKKDALIQPYKPDVVENKFKDLMFYVAIVLVVFLFIEWFLQARDNM